MSHIHGTTCQSLLLKLKHAKVFMFFFSVGLVMPKFKSINPWYLINLFFYAANQKTNKKNLQTKNKVGCPNLLRIHLSFQYPNFGDKVQWGRPFLRRTLPFPHPPGDVQRSANHEHPEEHRYAWQKINPVESTCKYLVKFEDLKKLYIYTDKSTYMKNI